MIKELVLFLSSVLLVHLAPAVPVPEPESTTCDHAVIVDYQNTMHQLGKGEEWHELLSQMIDESKKYDVNLLVDVSLLEIMLKNMDDLLDEMSAKVGVKRPFQHVQMDVQASRSVGRRGQVRPVSHDVDKGVHKYIRQITQSVVDSSKIYDQNLYDQDFYDQELELELEDNESRVERAISALRFDLINFVLAGDDIAEDIKESRTALGNSRKKDSQCNCIDCTDV